MEISSVNVLHLFTPNQEQGVYKNGRWNASESFETCVMRGPPTLFESGFIAFSVSRWRAAWARKNWNHQFKCSGFLVMFAHYIKVQFQVYHEVLIS